MIPRLGWWGSRGPGDSTEAYRRTLERRSAAAERRDPARERSARVGTDRGLHVPWWQWAFAAVAVLVGLSAWAYAPVEHHRNHEIRSASHCAADDPRTDCLHEVAGRVTDDRVSHGRYSHGRRWLFTPDAGAAGGTAYDASWVLLPGDGGDPEDWSAPVVLFASGAQVTALYWDDEPVAFVTPVGTVDTRDAQRDGWTALLWVGVGATCLGVMLPWTVWWRRRHGPDAGPVTSVVVLWPLLGLFGVFGAIFPVGLGPQLGAFAATAAVAAILLGLLVWWGHRRARRMRA